MVAIILSNIIIVVLVALYFYRPNPKRPNSPAPVPTPTKRSRAEEVQDGYKESMREIEFREDVKMDELSNSKDALEAKSEAQKEIVRKVDIYLDDARLFDDR